MEAMAARRQLNSYIVKKLGSQSNRFGGTRPRAILSIATRPTFRHSQRTVSLPSGLRHLPDSTIPNGALFVRWKASLSSRNQYIGRRPVVEFLYRTFAYCGFFIIAGGVLVIAFFIYDASTYRKDPSTEAIPVSELALLPRRGGPKNLPIAEVLLDDDDSEAMRTQRDKPRLVILGTGWGSISLLKTLNLGDYHVTVVSPTNYFLFTPMLPSATVGTLDLRSLVEPVRRITHRVRGHFLKAQAEDVDFSTKLVEVSQVDADGNKQHFYLPYDKLVIAVGTSCIILSGD
jgi:NADH:ubiquinone reductase (H+-translocating)